MSISPSPPECPTSGPISHSVERLRREFDRWLDLAFQQGGRALDAVGLRAADRPWSPAVDVTETPNDVHVDVDLPDVDPASVEVSLAGNMLTIQGPKRPPVLSEGAVVHVTERMHGPFQRSIPMPAPVTADGVTAEMSNGVLRLRMTKSETARALKIAVRAEPASARSAHHSTRPS